MHWNNHRYWEEGEVGHYPINPNQIPLLDFSGPLLDLNYTVRSFIRHLLVVLRPTYDCHDEMLTERHDTALLSRDGQFLNKGVLSCIFTLPPRPIYCNERQHSAKPRSPTSITTPRKKMYSAFFSEWHQASSMKLKRLTYTLQYSGSPFNRSHNCTNRSIGNSKFTKSQHGINNWREWSCLTCSDCGRSTVKEDNTKFQLCRTKWKGFIVCSFFM